MEEARDGCRTLHSLRESEVGQEADRLEDEDADQSPEAGTGGRPRELKRGCDKGGEGYVPYPVESDG